MNNDQNTVIEDGIEMCEDRCPCGGQLRLHTHTFNKNTDSSHVKYYVDCADHCGRSGEWRSNPDLAIEDFDKTYLK